MTPVDGLAVDAFVGKYGDRPLANDATLASPAWAQDSNLAGVYAMLTEGLLDPALAELDVYLLWDQRVLLNDFSAPDRRRITTLGVRARGQWGPVGLTLEGAVQRGRRCTLQELDEDPRRCDDSEFAESVQQRGAMADGQLRWRSARPRSSAAPVGQRR